jgi:hypothetical protein
MTQRQVVEQLLIQRGEVGVTAYEAIYDLGITRLATYIHKLRKEGWQIGMETKPGQTARYWLKAAPPGRKMPWRQEELFKL